MRNTFTWNLVLLILASPASMLWADSTPDGDKAGSLSASSAGVAKFSTRPLLIEDASPAILQATINGPEFHAPVFFHGAEDFDSPRMNRLRKEYHLDDVVRGATEEFDKILKLRHWVFTRWPVNNDQQFRGDTFAILEKAKTGAGFYCTHSMRVQHAVMTTMGLVARDLGVDVNHEALGRSGHHGVNEVWSNEYAKWVLLDAKYDVHFERDGLPLSALELHEAVRSGDDRVEKVKGPDRKTVPMTGSGSPETSFHKYWWISYHVQQNPFTLQYRGQDSRLVIFDNSAFRETTWYRGINPLREHWAYKANAFLPTADRHQIDWTPGVPELRVRQTTPEQLDVTLHSVTPNFKTYLVRKSGDDRWNAATGSRFAWNVKPSENVLEVRTRNRFDVDGPVVTAKVVFSEDSASRDDSSK